MTFIDAELMLIALLILIVGLSPSLVSLLILRRADARAQARLQLAMDSFSQRGLVGIQQRNTDQQYVEGVGYVVGDWTCQFNARSPYLRCAINPSGPCSDCSHYTERYTQNVTPSGT